MDLLLNISLAEALDVDVRSLIVQMKKSRIEIEEEKLRNISQLWNAHPSTTSSCVVSTSHIRHGKTRGDIQGDRAELLL